MLTKYMSEPWLSMGLYSYAATWLKIVYWDNDNTQNVSDTIAKAYKCCPEIEAVKLISERGYSVSNPNQAE